MIEIDLNCDLGEGLASLDAMGESAIMRRITSANICCGLHAGSPGTMRQTLQLAMAHDVRVGAHPGYPDREGFGRRSMDLSAEQLISLIRDQVSSLLAVARANGGTVHYVKPHGALYHDVCWDLDAAQAMVTAVESLSADLAIMGLPGSPLLQLCGERGIQSIAEGFADRRYLANGRLAPRGEADAIIESPRLAAQQFADLAAGRPIPSIDGTQCAMEVQSVCVHGDHPRILEVLEAITRIRESG